MLFAGVADVDDLQRRLLVPPGGEVGGGEPDGAWDCSGCSPSVRSTSLNAPRTRSKPMRARRTLALVARVSAPMRTIGWPGRATSPAYSAKRPSRPTFADPAGAQTRTPPGLGCRAAARPPGRSGRHFEVSSTGAGCRRAAAGAAVGVGGEREVERCHRLAVGDDGDEVVLARRAQTRSSTVAARRWSATPASDIDLPQAEPTP